MFVLLSGARQNSGDYLITQRAKELLRAAAPHEEWVQLPGLEPLDEHLEVINQSRGVIIMGGPGCQPRMYPNIYPLVKDLTNIHKNIYVMGSGWKGRDGSLDAVNRYMYTEDSLRLLRRISQTTAGISVRDHYTRRTLQNHGVQNVHMTGCPVWYSLEHIGVPYQPPEECKKICYTPPVDPKLVGQSLDVAKRLCQLLSDAEKYACFHHGFKYLGRSGNEAMFQAQRDMRDQLSRLGYEPVDLSGGQTFSFYDDCAVHIGYRVHAHIYMLSRRETSFLLYEDGRGAGVDDALRLPGVSAFPIYESNRWIRGARKVLRRSDHRYDVNENAPEEIFRLLERAQADGFSGFAGYPKLIDTYYGQMTKFLHQVVS